MFARSVSFHLKPGSKADFTKTLEKEILPMLRKQKGFQDEITLVAPNGTDALGISLWDVNESADAYARGAYATVLKSIEPVMEGTPEVQSYEVSNSTFHKIAARMVV
jgi:hypothetical protein